jgi:hypothetical protein
LAKEKPTLRRTKKQFEEKLKTVLVEKTNCIKQKTNIFKSHHYAALRI